MAIHFKLVRSNVKRNNSCGKYFAKAVSQGEVTLNELAEEAAANSGITKAAFKRALTELQDLMKERLGEGLTVILPGIGRFSLRIESIGVDDPKEFNIGRHISRIVCGFLPASHRVNTGSGTKNGHIVYDLCDGVKAVWHKGFKP